MSILTAAVLGLHLVSAHVPAKPDQNNFNPGVYLREEASSGWEVGAYYNTYKRPTAYLAKHWDLGHGFTVALGAATGYDKSCRTESTTTITVEQIQGGTLITKSTRNAKLCAGSSPYPIAPIGGVTWSPGPVGALGGASPRVWFAPGFQGSSSVIHASVEF